MYYNVPIIITKCDGVYYACSPDFNKFEDGSIDYHVTYGDTIDEAVNNVSEVIVLEMNDYVNENIEIPRLSTFDELQEKVGENQIISFVRLNLEYEIAKVKQALKNKTVVLPVWLDILAQEQKINFSQLLQQALKEELKIKWCS